MKMSFLLQPKILRDMGLQTSTVVGEIIQVGAGVEDGSAL